VHRFNLPYLSINHFNNINIGMFHEMQQNVMPLQTFFTIKGNEGLFITVWMFDLTSHAHDILIFYSKGKIFTTKRYTFCYSRAFIT
jgi:hypothetical protein